MNPLSIPPILSSLLFLFLGVFIYFQNRKSNINFTFLLVCLSTFWWQFSWFFLFNTHDKASAEILVKVGYVGIILLPVTFLHFCQSFLGKTDRLSKTILYFSYFVAFLFEISLFADNFFINGYYEYFWGFYPKAGFLHPFFLLFLTILLARVLFILINAVKKEAKNSLKHSQVEYILIAIVSYAFASSDFIVNYGYEFYPIGFIPILFFLGTIAYAIARYHLMNIRIILTESLVGIIAFVLLAQFFTATTNFEYLWKGGLFLSFLFLGYLLIKSVLQEIKRREELQKLYKKVDKLSKAKSEFLSIASHQLRTPLAAIKGYISMIIEGTYGKPNETIIKPLENVYQSNERLIRLVNDLLNLSRLEAGRIDFSPELISLEEIVVNIINELKINAENKKLYIKLIKPVKPMPKIMADPNKLRQVILNVLDNAIKYTNTGGITVEVNKIDSQEQIKVSDTGAGIDKKELEGLFQMFTRASAGTQLHVEGAGVGLHVAKKFIEMHNGKIWAESKGRGKGSTFYIQLPIK